ncbi:sensor histidine kinase [Streptomyces sp. NPDC021224]|uniref:sensor histidine kinase n=1 Tax=unclassified Streptomyces TaxID=2593676 RepID=UPI0037ACFF55
MGAEPSVPAQVLHDGVLQGLAVARIRLGRALAAPGPLPRDVGEALRELLDGEIAGLRRLVADAQHTDDRHADAPGSADLTDAPDAPPHEDLPTALAATAAHLESTTGVRIRVDNHTTASGSWAGNDLVAYRIVREALHNTARHSGAAHAWVSLASSRSRLVCVVSDDGHGFQPAQEAASRGHFGLGASYARARAAGGYLAVRSGGDGTSLTLSLPREPRPAPDGRSRR